MGVLWYMFIVTLATGNALELTNEQYHQLPQLFQLDDYEACLSQRRGVFCLATFDLLPASNKQLFNVIQQFSEDRTNFNHTRIHRGYCVSARCSHIDEVSLNRRFVKCVSNITKNTYGLDTKLATLEYCKTTKSPSTKPIDELDVTFAYISGFILLMNVIGTIYDLIRNPDHKPNRYLMTFSFAENWKRLTESYENGDSRLSSLQAIHGMKAITLIFVMMAHSVITYHTAYILNPRFIENGNRHPMSILLHNGTVVVQTFILLSSFLYAYNMFIYIENNPKKQLNLSMFPNSVLNRLSRILPVYIFVVGFVTTWWRHASDGPLWTPLVEAECSRCRDKWWSQFLFLNNFYKPDEKCLIQTWFLAVDFQLYVLAVFLTLVLGPSLRSAIKILSGLLVFSVAMNFGIAYYWDLKSVLFVTNVETIRSLYYGVPSFKWIYMAPWTSLPSSLLGLIAAFLLYHWQQNNYDPKESLICRILYRSSVPFIFISIISGYFIRDTQSQLVTAMYTAIDRPLFSLMIVVALLGFTYKIDSLWWQFLSWSGWRPLSRMSLSILLVHWCYNLTQTAIKTDLARTSIYEVGGHWFVTIFMTYVTSLPVHLLVELPLQRFLKAVFF
ncbi:PREDICTED: nose resistant to fluoxetine protein 6-like [Papilio polytes]|uniref:nose resistant to fluoxetine protein 6-like n=1 Tax=Papilio polytes TaxID=76194 RepID=UPI000675E02C|nr:PREDICTED: nose resistant to fluoxetine protein 6-like [Papilio polytes]